MISLTPLNAWHLFFNPFSLSLSPNSITFCVFDIRIPLVITRHPIPLLYKDMEVTISLVPLNARLKRRGEDEGARAEVMEGDTLSGLGNGNLIDNKVLQHFNNSFGQVQSILDQNRLLINEINQNHESKIPDNLTRNVRLIRELNNNIRRVVDLYADLSTSFSKSVEDSSNGGSAGTLRSDGKAGLKRVRSG